MIAYLVLAHANPVLVGRLIDRLSHPADKIFLHVDARANADAFRSTGATLIENRVSVHWSGFSMVQATLNLLETAFASGANRFVLLSGQDYPVKPLRVIREFLVQNLEYLQVDFLPTDGIFYRRATTRFLGDRQLLNPREGQYVLRHFASSVSRWLPRQSHPLAVYYGPSWWALTREAVREILDTPLQSFRRVQCPDEMYFQTLLKSSSRAKNIAFDQVDGGYTAPKHRAALHYVNWERPNPGNPRTLNMEDFEDIIRSNALFARKMGPTTSVELMDAVDALM